MARAGSLSINPAKRAVTTGRHPRARRVSRNKFPIAISMIRSIRDVTLNGCKFRDRALIYLHRKATRYNAVRLIAHSATKIRWINNDNVQTLDDKYITIPEYL